MILILVQYLQIAPALVPTPGDTYMAALWHIDLHLNKVLVCFQRNRNAQSCMGPTSTKCHPAGSLSAKWSTYCYQFIVF